MENSIPSKSHFLSHSLRDSSGKGYKATNPPLPSLCEAYYLFMRVPYPVCIWYKVRLVWGRDLHSRARYQPRQDKTRLVAVPEWWDRDKTDFFWSRAFGKIREKAENKWIELFFKKIIVIKLKASIWLDTPNSQRLGHTIGNREIKEGRGGLKSPKVRYVINEQSIMCNQTEIFNWNGLISSLGRM